MTANVTQEETVIAALKHIVEESGGLHGMVVNAGRTHHKAALDFTAEEIHNLFSVNVSPAIENIIVISDHPSSLAPFFVLEPPQSSSLNSTSRARSFSLPPWPHIDPTKYVSSIHGYLDEDLPFRSVSLQPHMAPVKLVSGIWRIP